MDIARDLQCQRSSLLRRLERALDAPMAVLGLVWLVLVALELAGRSNAGLLIASQVIWVVFIADFALKFVLAPDKLRFLRRNLLTLFSLALPAVRSLAVLRGFRVLRATRAVRGLRLVRLITSLNRGIRALGRTLHRRGFGYVMLLTLVVLFAGAAGMLAFEGGPDGLLHYGDALWWTAMMLVTMGSDWWPRTPEGRMLCLLLSVYGFTMFGYVTATLGSFFISSDGDRARARAPADDPPREVRGPQATP
ncbi:ion transporter [Ramlibacter sp. AN1015]|uniref:ion transporter n=1 Tax=Ramlibacter sp. AN1015 TaxID=3133428 RepID=UPI0030C01F09